MHITFDPAKNEKTIRERGLSFELVADLEWGTAVSVEDTRKDYGEKRVQVTGLIHGRLHVAVITRRGDSVHVISLRKANPKEVKRNEQKKG